MSTNLENPAVVTKLEKVNLHPNSEEEQYSGIFKLLDNCTHLLCKGYTQNPPKPGFQQYMNQEFPNVQVGFRKGRGTRDQIANIRWTIEKAREFQKNISLCFIDYAKAFDYVDHNKWWKTLEEMGIANHLTCFLRNLYMG